MKLKFYFRHTEWADRVEVYLVGEKHDGTKYLAKPTELVFEPISLDGVATKPTLEFNGFMSREFFPALAEGLAEVGYRAKTDEVGELKATKLHLQDLQKLVFK